LLVKDELLSDLKGKEIVQIKPIHCSAQDKLLPFEWDDESAGTRKFLALAGPWLNALEHGLSESGKIISLRP
jgi:uncharacterized protein